MKNTYKIIFGLLALAGVYTLVLISLSPSKTNTPSTGLLASFGIGSAKTDKTIESELSGLKQDYISALGKINALESKTVASGLNLNNFRFTETSETGQPNKLIVEAKNGATWDYVEDFESAFVNP